MDFLEEIVTVEHNVTVSPSNVKTKKAGSKRAGFKFIMTSV